MRRPFWCHFYSRLCCCCCCCWACINVVSAVEVLKGEGGLCLSLCLSVCLSNEVSLRVRRGEREGRTDTLNRNSAVQYNRKTQRRPYIVWPALLSLSLSLPSPSLPLSSSLSLLKKSILVQYMHDDVIDDDDTLSGRDRLKFGSSLERHSLSPPQPPFCVSENPSKRKSRGYSRAKLFWWNRAVCKVYCVLKIFSEVLKWRNVLIFAARRWWGGSKSCTE